LQHCFPASTERVDFIGNAIVYGTRTDQLFIKQLFLFKGFDVLNMFVQQVFKQVFRLVFMVDGRDD
jgi:hypothetical protein